MSRPPVRRAPRGQGTVELALGTLVFVSILVFGIHFAELGMMKLRVQQAATAALWDTTGLRMHRFDTPVSEPPELRTADELRDADGRQPGPRAEARFRDFEGLSEGGRRTFTQAMTRGSRLNVVCDPVRVSPLPTGGAFTRLRVAYAPPQFGGVEVDGMSCSAEARVQAWGMPTRFLDRGGRGFFQVDNVLQPQLRVCAFGRAGGGRCQGSVSIALDDWGLSGSEERFGSELAACGQDCLFDGKGNQAYKRTVERLFERYNSFETKDFSIPDFMRELFTDSPSVPELANVPVDERAFRLVFIGEDGPNNSEDGGERPFSFKTHEQDTVRPIEFEWATSPYADAYKQAHDRREQCFLGTRCDRSAFDKGSW
jgi:hypothetical protein